jgi:tripartite-type tricarboxylate transporter receptor subunit TctC
MGAMQAGSAAEFPIKPVTLVLGFAPGGPSDVMARILTKKMEESLKQPVVIENRAGAGGGIAATAVARAAPDGYTILLATGSSLAINVSLYKSLSYDPEKDFEPISLIGTQTNLLYTHPGSVPATTLGEFVAYVNANPGKLTFGSGGGTGSSLHLAAELLRLKTGIQFQNVTYRGAAAALNDLLGAHIDLMFDAMPVMSQQAKAGNVTPLAVTSAKRSPVLPDVPTMTEAGLKDFEVVNYFALFAPPKTPPAIAQRLRDEIAKAISTPDMVEQFAKQGMAPVASQPADFAKYLQADLDRWTHVIKDAGLKPE